MYGLYGIFYFYQKIVRIVRIFLFYQKIVRIVRNVRIMFQIIRIFRIARKTSLKSLFLLENFLKKSSKSSLTYWLIAVSIDSQNSFFHYQICSLENMFRKYMVSHKKKTFQQGVFGTEGTNFYVSYFFSCNNFVLFFDQIF